MGQNDIEGLRVEYSSAVVEPSDTLRGLVDVAALVVHSLPGHDRECAMAMHRQALNRRAPLDTVQVGHLLAIGYRAGIEAARQILEEQS